MRYRGRVFFGVVAAFAFFVATTAPASAQLSPSALDSDDMAWFYNREGESPERVAADQQECLNFGSGMYGGGYVDPRYGLTGAVLMPIISAGPTVAYADDCMMAKGYRRFNVPGRLRQFQERLQAATPDILAAYAGASEPPEGVLSRVWVNTYWLPAGDEAAPGAEPRQFTPRAMTLSEANRWGPPDNIRPLSADAQVALEGDQALVVMTVRSPTGAGLRFERSDPATGGAGIVRDGRRQRWPSFDVRAGAEDTSPKRVMFAVPAGTYSLAAAWTWRWANGTEFCLGTVAVQIEPGEIVDLGDFSLDRGAEVSALSTSPHVRLRIDQPALDAARLTLLGGAPLAERMRAARYVNKFPRQCRLFNRGYGFDLPAAPDWQASEPAAQPGPQPGGGDSNN